MLGYEPSIGREAGIRSTWQWFSRARSSVSSIAQRGAAGAGPEPLARRSRPRAARWPRCPRDGLRDPALPAQPRLGLPGFLGHGPPGPAGRPAVGDVGRDAAEAVAGRHPGGALARRVTFCRVGGRGQPVTAQRQADRMVGHADLGGDGVHGPVLREVALGQVAGHIGVSEPVQRGQPPGVAARGARPQLGRGGSGIDIAKVTRQPVLVEPGLPADGREAGPVGRPGQDERPDIRVPVPPGHVGSDPGEAGAGPLGVRLGDRGDLGRGHRLPCLPAALLRVASSPGRRGGVPGELPGTGPRTSRGAARPYGGVEDEA